MIKCNDWPIGVCVWSMGNDLDKMGQLRQETNLTHMNLGLWPAIDGTDSNFLARVKKESWDVSATVINFPQEDYSTLDAIKATGGIVMDKYWYANKQRVFRALEITAEMGVKYLLFHFGFFDHKDARAAQRFKDKVKTLADAAVVKKVHLLMETGQETAEDLKMLLEELKHPALFVNLDPGNMILYNKGNPVEAVKTLGPWIRQIHAKDALRTKVVGTWGQEMPWGEGEVGTDAFLKALKRLGFKGVLAIEREAGDNRYGDIKLGVDRLTKWSA
jgi:L-ribulose-5-phosphate 3-epimerase